MPLLRQVCYYMKSSGKGRKRTSSKCLVVDGYNIIPRWKKRRLSAVDSLEEVRNDLVDRLGEYRSFAALDVIVVFDAHKTAEAGTQFTRSGVDIMFTEQHETADERIERIVYDLGDKYREMTVATSDAAEQQVAFGKGALRITADELLRQLDDVETRIRRAVEEQTGQSQRSKLSDSIRQDIAKILEKWRRE